MKVKLSELILKLESGGRPKGGAIKDSKAIPSIGAEHLNDNGGFNLNSLKYIPIEYYNRLKSGRIEKHNILVVKDGATTGKTSYVHDQYPFSDSAVNEHVFVIKIDSKKAFPFYIYQYLRSPQGKKEILSDFRGATVGGISRKFIDRVNIQLLPLKDQIRIANILSRAEALIAKRKESIQLLDELLKSTFLDMFGDPLLNPKKFPVKILKEFYINEKDGTKCGPFGSALKKHEYENSGIPVWNMDNITKDGQFVNNVNLWINKEKYIELEKYNVQNGDILISRAGTIGKMCEVESEYNNSIISTNLIRVRLGNNLLPLYFVSLMNYCKDRVAKLRTGADDTFTHMNTGILDSIKFPYPPIELQNQFAQIVKKVEGIKNKYQESLQELENLYASLSQKAFKGELDLSKMEVKDYNLGHAEPGRSMAAEEGVGYGNKESSKK